ncbi:MAG: hypothetical protein AAGF12_13780 [Myxococcota bacterium]
MKQSAISIALVLAVGTVGCSGDSADSVLPGVEAIVFVSVNHSNEDGSSAAGAGNVFNFGGQAAGGNIFLLSPPSPDGTLTNLTERFTDARIEGIDTSFDGKFIYAGLQHRGFTDLDGTVLEEDRYYHLWEIAVDGSSFRQITFGDAHDMEPVVLPGDRLAFTTTEAIGPFGQRRDEYERGRPSQMGTVSITAGDADRRLCTENLSFRSDPSLMSDGRILFSNWEHLGNRNDMKLFAMNPDCTSMVAVFGEFGKRFNSAVQPVELAPGRFVAVATSREGTYRAGALIEVDARSLTSSDLGRLDVQQASFTNLTPAVPTGEGSPAANVGRYRQPQILPGTDNLLVSWANGDVNERTEATNTHPNFGLYVWDPETRERVLLFDDPDFSELFGMAVGPRDIPPVRGDFLGDYDITAPTEMGSIDVTQTSLPFNVNGGQFDGTPVSEAMQAAVGVNLIRGFSSEAGPVRDFGLTMEEGAELLGVATVREDGSWRALVPAYEPIHAQTIDTYGMAIQNQRLWMTGMPGEARTCGGCHASRSEDVLPRNGTTTIAQQLAPEDFNFEPGAATGIPWAFATTSQNPHNNIQDLFDSRCVQCHDGGDLDPFADRFWEIESTLESGEMFTQQIPYLRLTGELLEVTYEDEVVAYPMSYVTLLLPGSMMGDTVATGDVPPEWVVLGTAHNARRSALIAAVNAVSATDPTDFAFDRPAHPEDVGVSLTREERMMLIRMADFGGQFYSLENIEQQGGAGPRDYDN